MATNNRSRLSSILSNRRTLIIISILLAIITWLAISVNESPVVERTIKNVKVQVDDSVPKQLGYEAFGADDVYVDVTVSGKRYEVGDNVLTAKDIRVVASTSYVDEPGRYTLQLRASAKDSNADYTIVSKSQDYIEVYFDTPKTVEIELEPVVKHTEPIVSGDDYITDDPVLSVTKLTLFGPTTEIDKVEHAYATVSTDGNLKKPETQKARLSIVDEDNKEVKYIQNLTGGNVTLTIPVYKKTTMPVTVGFTNVPTKYIKDFPSFTISPGNIAIAVDPTKLRDMESISLGNIDFQNLTSGTNTFRFKASDITDGKPLNEEQEFTVTVTLPQLSSKELTVDLTNMTIRNGPRGFAYTGPDTSITLTLVGPAADLKKITADDITVVADLKGQNIVAGSNSVPLTITVDSATCWSYGIHTAAITATKQ